MSRSLGWTLLTTRSPMEIVPAVIFSSPASIRNRVDLPQPEGPTRTTKAPSSIGIETPCRTSKPPNDFRTSRICTDDILTLPILTSAVDAAVILLLRGLTRLFCRCRSIKVVGFWLYREHCGGGIHVLATSAQNELAQEAKGG